MNKKIFEKYELESAKDEAFLLPDGSYELIIASAEEKETKSGGSMISVKFVVPSDASEHANRGFYENFNVVNQNETAQNIGRSQFKKLLAATGSEDIDDVEELVGLSLTAEVGKQDGKNGYNDSNKIRKYA